LPAKSPRDSSYLGTSTALLVSGTLRCSTPVKTGAGTSSVLRTDVHPAQRNERQAMISEGVFIYLLRTFNVPQLTFADNLASDGLILDLSDAQFKVNLQKMVGI
jgi:hypothetical protein